MATGFAAWTNQFGVGLSLHNAYRFRRTLQRQKMPDFEGVCSFFLNFRLAAQAVFDVVIDNDGASTGPRSSEHGNVADQ
jgi:hypothetical protein